VFHKKAGNLASYDGLCYIELHVFFCTMNRL